MKTKNSSQMKNIMIKTVVHFKAATVLIMYSAFLFFF